MKLRILLMAVIVAVSVVARVGGSDFTKTGLIGIITDSSDVPIPYAVVFVHEGKGKMIVRKVNPDGSFQLLLPAGYYEVFFSAVGFAPSCRRIRLSPGEEKKLHPKLDPSLETLED